METKRLVFIFLASCMFIIGIAQVGVAQDLTAYQTENFIHRGDTLPYRILYPENYQADQKYPVIFFLHGSGERGNNNQAQLTHGGKLFLLDSIRKKYPAIVIFPQCPANSFWSNVIIKPNSIGKRAFFFQKGGRPTKALDLLNRLVKKVLKEEDVDQNRIYIGGLSMGAMGTFEMLRRHPKTFAAAFAICGADNVENTQKYAHVPLWIFHGEKDDVVLPENSIRIVETLKFEGANPRFNLYPNDNHNSWDSAFAEPELLAWLFKNSKLN